VYGVGELTSLVTLCELGDVSRLHASRQAVRLAGIDIGVHRSDRHARLGKPDYLALKDRGLSHTRASLTIARKLARRSYHLLRELGPAALDPINDSTAPTVHPLRQAHPSPMRHHLSASSPSARGTHQRGGPPKTQRPESLQQNDRSTISSPTAHTDGRGPRYGRASTEPNNHTAMN
jgi:Transposase IS116/IS110/IS902 family